MKGKNLLSAAVSLVCGITSAFSAASMSALADTYTGGGDASAAVTKPVLTINIEGKGNGVVYDNVSDIAGKTINCTLDVSGAENYYVSTGIHIYYDSRYELVLNARNRLAISGDAIDYLSPSIPKEVSICPEGFNGFFVATAGAGNDGCDGEMWKFKLKVPEDAKTGDVFPIDIIYKGNDDLQDLFINEQCNEDGLNMQAYAFTQGIFNEDTNNNFAASAADIAKCSALAKIDKSYDGYIAIADDAPVTTTTTAKVNSNSFNIIKDQISYDSGGFDANQWSPFQKIDYQASNSLESIKWFSDSSSIKVDSRGYFSFKPNLQYLSEVIEGTVYGIATFKDGTNITDSVKISCESHYAFTTTSFEETRPRTTTTAATTTTTATTKPKKSAASIVQFSSCPESIAVGDSAQKMEAVIECSEGDFSYDITFDDPDISVTKSYKEGAGTKQKITAFVSSSNNTERYATGTLTIRPDNAYDTVSKTFTVYVKVSGEVKTTSAATTAPAAVTTKAAVQPPRVSKGVYLYVGDTLSLEGAEDGDYGAVTVADGVVTPKQFGWSVIKVGGEDMLITVPEPTIEVSANGTNVTSSVTVPYTQGMEIKYVLKNYHHSKEKIPAWFIYDSADEKLSTQKWDSFAGYKNAVYDSKNETLTYTMIAKPSDLDSLVPSGSITGRLKLKAAKMNDITGMCDPEIKLYKSGGQWYVDIAAPQSPAPFYGDANLDGKVSVADSVAILQYIGAKDKYPMSQEAIKNGDVFSTGDGLTAKDALTLQKYDSKLIDVLPEK